MTRNHRTDEGIEMGRELARLCDSAEPAARLRVPELPPRCASCALRAGRHIANNSPFTLMDVVKCVAEHTPFHCHEREGYCSGWAMMVLATEDREPLTVPWGFTGQESPDD
jgi:hypothetical protein